MDSPRFKDLSEMFQLHRQSQSMSTPVLATITLWLATVSLLGIAGNSLVIMFFSRSLKDLPQNVYVIALAALDLVVCAVVIPSTIYQDVWLASSSDLACKLFNILRYSLVPSSAFLLCLIAVDRFVIICFVPGIQSTRKNSLLYITLVLVLGFALGIPGGLSTGASVRIAVEAMVSKFNGDFSVTHCTSDFGIISESVFKAYRTVLTTIFFIMLLLLVFFYANIFCFVRKRQRRWAKSRSYVAAKLTRGKSSEISSTGGVGRRWLLNRRWSSSCGGGAGGRSSRRLLSVGRLDEVTEVTSCVEARRPSMNVLQRTERQRKSPTECLETDIDEALAASASPVMNGRQKRISETSEMVCPEQAEADGDAIELGEMPSPSFIEEDPETRPERINSVASEHLTQARQDLAERSRKRPHIKTAKVLSVITFFYVLSYLPFFLVYNFKESMSQGVPSRLMIETGNATSSDSIDGWRLARGQNRSNIQLDFDSGKGGGGGGDREVSVFDQVVKVMFYFYFINHCANPLIYGCMNTYFKQQVCALIGSLRCRRR